MNHNRGPVWTGPGAAPGPLADQLQELSQFETTIWTMLEAQIHI